MDIEIIEDFLPQDELDEVKNLVMSDRFPYYIQNAVACETEQKNSWNWYATHTLYVDDFPRSEFCHEMCDRFIPRFPTFKSLIRAKVNFYPWTETLHEHALHSDYHYDIKTIIFSLNTCDGYTKFENGTKFNSVENKALFFNGKDKHLSTTTTSCKGRYNIVFNFF